MIKLLVNKLKEATHDVVERFTMDNFKSFNFPHKNRGSFTVDIENRLADSWQDCLEKKFGTPTVFRVQNVIGHGNI